MKRMLIDTTAKAQKKVAMARSQISAGIWLRVDGMKGPQLGVMAGRSMAKVSMSCQRFWRLDLDPLRGRAVGVVILVVVITVFVMIEWCSVAVF